MASFKTKLLIKDKWQKRLVRFGNDEQCQRFLPGCISGETILAVAMTEPDAGSDLAGMRSNAVEKDDHWVLNGSKTFISNGINADLIVVWGNNVTISNLHLIRVIKKAREQGARIVIVDPKRIKAAEQCDLFLQIQPGTDVVLALAAAAELERRSALDKAFIDRWTLGFDAYMAEARKSDDGGYLLVENHCPVCSAAAACTGLCRAELEVFQQVLGEDVTVERSDHILAGARRCAYRVTRTKKAGR